MAKKTDSTCKSIATVAGFNIYTLTKRLKSYKAFYYIKNLLLTTKIDN